MTAFVHFISYEPFWRYSTCQMGRQMLSMSVSYIAGLKMLVMLGLKQSTYYLYVKC